MAYVRPDQNEASVVLQYPDDLLFGDGSEVRDDLVGAAIGQGIVKKLIEQVESGFVAL